MIDNQTGEHPDFGPLASHSEHRVGDVIEYTSTDGNGTSTGAILWVQEPQEIAGRHHPLCYVVEASPGSFPEFVQPSDVIASKSA